ncbi:DMT family transporter [Lampropedia puyangensis]|uniref:DMT family transporter n=2 Tax=Lampropedia puyangensis TaxID=1330072 RepID=A0A4S8EQQ9_9BURK|nr:DMT family transporter [Lampropedia puyangensis]
MVAAMAAFALEDMFVKRASQGMPIAQVLVLLGLGGMLIFGLITRSSGRSVLVPEVLSRTMAVRAIFEVTGRLFFVLALALTPLSSTTVILQATPLVVVAAAAWLFGERVGWQRWLAIVVGLCGVLVIVQPWSDGFSPLAILALIGMLGFAGRDLASRLAPASLGAAVLGFYGYLSVVVAGVAVAIYKPAAWVWGDAVALGAIVLASAIGTTAYASLMKAMRTGDVSAVTPLRYSRLLFGIGLGVIFFGEALSPSTFWGAGLIVVSGLFTLMRAPAR